MKLSQTKDLSALTLEQMDAIIFSDCYDDGKSADVALVLGTRPENCVERAEKAAEVYSAGRVKYVIPSGGVEWDYDGGRISEANFMKGILVGRGVPESAIILENEATTTKENMLFGAVQINRALRFENVKSVCIVTCAIHMKRSKALAKWLLPRGLELSFAPSGTPEEKGDWRECEQAVRQVKNEISLMKGLIDRGMIDDIEF